MKTLIPIALGTALVSGLCLLFACSSNYDKESMGTSADSFSITGLSGDSVKLVKTADMDFKVENVHESARKIVKAVHSINGLVADRQIESVKENSKKLQVSDDTLQIISTYNIRANMMVRVPSSKLDTFVEQVYQSGVFMNNINIKVEDKSLDYLASHLKQQNRERVLRQREQNPTSNGNTVSPKDPGEEKTFGPDDLIQSRDEIIDQQIANRQISADVNYSTVHLTFTQNPVVRMEFVPNTDLGAYRLPFWRSMNNAFSRGWQYFLNFLIGITHLWMFILLGLGVVLGHRYYRLRRV